jgi:outer membrane protein assembly factor BamB
MIRVRTTRVVAAATGLLAAVLSSQGRGNPTDWPTAYGDAQHSSWIRTDANISIESMSQPGFALQWKTTLESPARQDMALTQGVVTPGVNLFTPLSTVAGPANLVFALDNDTGNVFWTRRFDGSLPPGTAACPGGIIGAPTRVVSVVPPPAAAARGGAPRGGRAYGGAVGEPGAGVPISPPARGRAGAARGQPAAPAARGEAPPAAAAPPPPPASPFPTNPAAVAAAGGGRAGGGGLFRSSGVIHVVSGDGMFRTLGLVSGKDVTRPAPFLPAGARSSDLIGIGETIYTATSGGCGGAASGIWSIGTGADPKTVVSWGTNGGDPIGSVVFSSGGTLIAAVGAAPTKPAGAAPGASHANAIVALDPKSLALKDWFAQPGVVFAAAPIVFQEGGRDIVAATTTDGRLIMLDAASLGGANHATPLFASQPLTKGSAGFGPQSPATWHESPSAPGAPADVGGTRWVVIPVSTGGVLGVRVTHQNETFAIQPGWASAEIASPLTPIIVNGVVFVASGPTDAPARLYALNGSTGRTMWESGSAIGAPISGRSFWTGSGHVFVGTRDGTVYAFGFDMERGTPEQRAGWR